MFGVLTDQMVTHSFSDKDVLIEVVNIGFFLVVNASYVMVALQVMTDLGAMIFNEHDPKKISWKRRAPLLVLTNGLPVLIAMVLPNVRPAFEIGGSFGGCLSNFVFPPLLYWWNSGLKAWHWKSLLLGFLGLFGLVAMVLGTYQAVTDAIETFKGG
jgi:amino acid permease